MRLYLSLLCHLQRVIDLNDEVADGAFQAGSFGDGAIKSAPRPTSAHRPLAASRGRPLQGVTNVSSNGTADVVATSLTSVEIDLCKTKKLCRFCAYRGSFQANTEATEWIDGPMKISRSVLRERSPCCGDFGNYQ